MTGNNNIRHPRLVIGRSVIVISLRVNWRAMLVPAAAVLPAPKAYGKVFFQKKKHVVGFLPMTYATPLAPFPNPCCPGRSFSLLSETVTGGLRTTTHTHRHTPSSLRVLSVSLCLQLASPFLRLSVFTCRCVSVSLSLSLLSVCRLCMPEYSFLFFGLLPYGAATSIEDITKGTFGQTVGKLIYTGWISTRHCSKLRLITELALHSDILQSVFFFSTRYLYSMFARKNQLNQKRNKGHDS